MFLRNCLIISFQVSIPVVFLFSQDAKPLLEAIADAQKVHVTLKESLGK